MGKRGQREKGQGKKKKWGVLRPSVRECVRVCVQSRGRELMKVIQRGIQGKVFRFEGTFGSVLFRSIFSIKL